MSVFSNQWSSLTVHSKRFTYHLCCCRIAAGDIVINNFLIKDVFTSLIPPVIAQDDRSGLIYGLRTVHRDAAAFLLLLSLISLYVFICGNRAVMKRWGRGSSSQRTPTCPSAETSATGEYVSGPGSPLPFPLRVSSPIPFKREWERTLGLVWIKLRPRHTYD